MEFLELKNKILKKELPDFFIFAGDSDLINIYLDKIKEFKEVKVLTSIKDYLNIKQSKINIIDNDYVYLIKEDEIFKENSSLWNNNYPNLIFIYTNLKKTDKFYKAFEKDIVYFNKLTQEDLKGAIKYKVTLPDEDIEWIIKECKGSYSLIMNEVDKLSLFPKEDHQKLFNIFKQSNIFCHHDDIDSFAFSNAISDRDKVKALELIFKLSKYDMLSQLSISYNTLRNQLLVQNHNTTSTTLEQKAAELNINKGMYYILSKKKNYTIEELCRALYNCSELINNIKLGLIDSEDAINLFVLRYI